MCMYMCMFMSMYMYIYIYIYVYICICIYTRICICVCTCLPEFLHAYIYLIATAHSTGPGMLGERCVLYDVHG